jgi:hypothetical protein
MLLCVAAGAFIAASLSTRFMDTLAAPLTRPLRWMAGFGQSLARNRPWWLAPARPSTSGRSPQRDPPPADRERGGSPIRRRME